MTVFVLMAWLGLGEDNTLAKNACLPGDVHSVFLPSTFTF